LTYNGEKEGKAMGRTKNSKRPKRAAPETIVLTSEEQLAFWKALNTPAKLTEAQRRLGKLMRGQRVKT
jgi:hypothetical protein